MRHANIDIHHLALVHNLKRAQALAANSNILAMVKANAYGHGSIDCLPALQQADALGVATFAEAMQLRENSWQKPIVMIEGVFSENEWQQALIHKISCVVHHQAQLDWAIQHKPDVINCDNSHAANDAKSENHTPDSSTIWLKVNTGMNRLGFSPEQIPAIAKQLHDAGYQLVLISHFANADVKQHPLNQQQCHTFAQLLTNLKQQISPKIQCSLCNSAGIINFPEYHLDWVRPGIMLYGSSPVADKTAAELNLQPVMSFSAALMAIDNIAAGTAIGYGSRYVSKHAIKKGIVSIGYGDGYPRVINEHAWVGLINNNTTYRCPVIGRVAMDMIAIDLSNVPNPQIGDKVILWGRDNTNIPDIDMVASWADTISYELLCRLTTRPVRTQFTI